MLEIMTLMMLPTLIIILIDPIKKLIENKPCQDNYWEYEMQGPGK